MSLTRSDNRFETHPKPVQEYERKFVDGSYLDWDSTSEVNEAVEIFFRKNKYFWIDGSYYQCDDDGTTYRPIGSGATSPPGTVSLTNETYYEIEWDAGMQALFGSFPRGVQVYLTQDGVTRLATVDIQLDGLPPSFTKIKLYLPGLPGYIVIF